MEPFSISTIFTLLDKCWSLFNTLHEAYKRDAQLPEKISSIQKLFRDIDARIKRQNDEKPSTYDDKVIRNWIHDLEEIKRKIKDSIDNFNFDVKFPSSGEGSSEGVIKKVRDVVDAVRNPCRQLHEDIETINKLVKTFEERAKLFQVPVATDGSNKDKDIYKGHPIIGDPVGLETPKNELVKLMSDMVFQRESKSEEYLQKLVVGIYGPSGSGKSVLADEVYRHVKKEFDFKAQVTASRCENDLKKIIEQFKFEPQKGWDAIPHRDLRNQLESQMTGKKKRCIVLIDEIEYTSYWDNIIYAFPDNISVRIIVTTRSEEIAEYCSNKCQAYKMQPLNKNAAQQLLENKAFHNIADRPNKGDESYVKGLTEILDICEYHPLAISDMGQYLRDEKNWWKKSSAESVMDIQENIKSLLFLSDDNMERKKFKAMKYVFDCSYNRLRIQKCLLSLSTCSNGEENSGIKRKSVIRIWQAEGLVKMSETGGSKDLANQCFNDLICNGFIIPMKLSCSGEVKTFRVHRMMLPFIKAFYQDSVSWITIHEQGQEVKPSGNIIQICLRNMTEKPSANAMTKKAINMDRIRSLTCDGMACSMRFECTKFLRVLVLENIKNLEDGDLDNFCCRAMLKYLSIRGSANVSNLPKNIVQLQMLETLDTRGTSITKIPMDFILLPELIHLFGEFQITGTGNYTVEKGRFSMAVHDFCEGAKEKLAPQGGRRRRSCKAAFGTTKSITIEKSKLQTLAGFVIDGDGSDFVKLLSCMPKLSKVRILCRETTPRTKVIQDLVEGLKTCLEKNNVGDGSSTLYSLSIDFNDFQMNFLDKLKIESSYHLCCLKLHGKLTKLPGFLSTLDSLVELCLLETNLGVTVLAELRHLKILQFLKLKTGHPIKIDKKHTSELTFADDWFFALKRLYIDVPNFPKTNILKDAMKGLESLQLTCNIFGGISGIVHLVRLEEVILPIKFREQVSDFEQQVRDHHNKPKLRDVNGSSWQPIV